MGKDWISHHAKQKFLGAAVCGGTRGRGCGRCRVASQERNRRDLVSGGKNPGPDEVVVQN